jgi:DNA replication protein DnaC
MTDEETITKLIEMRMGTMAQTFRDLIAQAPGSQLSFNEQVALMVDSEWTERDNRKLSRLTRAAKLSVADASIDNMWCDPERGIDKALIRELGTGKWIRNKQNVIIVGKTGVGKTFLSAALAQTACRHGKPALCTRVSRLLNDLAIAHADGSYAQPEVSPHFIQSAPNTCVKVLCWATRRPNAAINGSNHSSGIVGIAPYQ